MTKIKLNFLTLLFLVLCFSSCTMEKRIYSSGYHIERINGNRNSVKKENDNGRAQTKLNKFESVEHTEMASNSVNNSTTVTDQNITASLDNTYTPLAKKESSKLISTKKRVINKQEATINSTIKADFKKETNTFSKNANDSPETNPLAKLSFISAILSIILLGIIPSLLLGAIAIRQFKRNPGKYKNKWLAIVGVIIGYIGNLVCLVFSLVFGIFGSFLLLIPFGIFLMNIIVSTNILLEKPD